MACVQFCRITRREAAERSSVHGENHAVPAHGLSPTDTAVE